MTTKPENKEKTTNSHGKDSSTGIVIPENTVSNFNNCTLLEIYEKYGPGCKDAFGNSIEINGVINKLARKSMEKVNIKELKGGSKIELFGIGALHVVKSLSIKLRKKSTLSISASSIIEATIIGFRNANIIIDRGCMLSSGVIIIANNDHTLYALDGTAMPIKDIKIGKHVWVGVGAHILGGADIGTGSVVGSYAVCAGRIPNNCTCAGNPCRVLRRDVFWSARSLDRKINYFDLPEKDKTVKPEYICNTLDNVKK